MTNTVSHIEDTWNVVEHNWHETSIYAKDNNQCICKLDTEDWDVNEDNQYELEDIQKKVARLISAAPDMLKALNMLQQGVKSGQITMDEQSQQTLNQVITQATI